MEGGTLAATLAFAVLLAACSGSDAAEPTASQPTLPAIRLDACGFAEPRAGTIDVSERFDVFHQESYSRVNASFHDHPDPTYHEVLLEEGDCRYLRAKQGFCDPACAGDEICTIDDRCEPYPLQTPAGTLTFSGLAERVVVDPEQAGTGTYVGPGGLPGELFGIGDAIRVTVSGDEFPQVALGARGVAAMDTDLTRDGLAFSNGMDGEVTWMVSDDEDACVSLVLNSFNALHGAPLSDIIECESPDDGSLLVPQALLEQFPLGETPEVTEGYDWPHSELTRYTRGTKQVEPGAATLIVRSTSYFRFSHVE
jgi:hypothetical protein